MRMKPAEMTLSDKAAASVHLTWFRIRNVAWVLLVLVGFLVAGVSRVEAAPAQKVQLKIKDFGITEGRIVFTYILGEQRDIYVLDFEKLTIEPLYASPAADEYPTWSPDGRSGIFTEFRHCF